MKKFVLEFFFFYYFLSNVSKFKYYVSNDLLLTCILFITIDKQNTGLNLSDQVLT